MNFKLKRTTRTPHSEEIAIYDPGTLDERDLESSLGIPHIFLINDLEANGYGIPELATESIFTLHSGDPDASGHAGLIAAGTAREDGICTAMVVRRVFSTSGSESPTLESARFSAIRQFSLG